MPPPYVYLIQFCLHKCPFSHSRQIVHGMKTEFPGERDWTTCSKHANLFTLNIQHNWESGDLYDHWMPSRIFLVTMTKVRIIWALKQSWGKCLWTQFRYGIGPPSHTNRVLMHNPRKVGAKLQTLVEIYVKKTRSCFPIAVLLTTLICNR